MEVYSEYVKINLKRIDAYIEDSKIEKAVSVMKNMKVVLTYLKVSNNEDYGNAKILFNEKLEDLIGNDHKEFTDIEYFDGVYPVV